MSRTDIGACCSSDGALRRFGDDRIFPIKIEPIHLTTACRYANAAADAGVFGDDRSPVDALSSDFVPRFDKFGIRHCRVSPFYGRVIINIQLHNRRLFFFHPLDRVSWWIALD